MYELAVNRYDSLPALAWLARVVDHDVSISCGNAVDSFEKGIFEGAWAGNFADASFDQARTIMGSGMKLRENDIIFVPPSHTLEALYVFEKQREIYVSNSIAFLFQAGDIEPIFDKDIGAKMASTVKGIHDYDTQIFSTKKGVVYRFLYNNFTVSPTGKIAMSPKDERFLFSGFHSYIQEVEQDFNLVIQNAASSLRKEQFSVITTCSSGYDSLTGAVLSSKFGCNEALTLKNARGGENDSGKSVGETIGLRVHELERVDSVKNRDSSEAEFLATGMGGEDYVYKAFEPFLNKRLLVTGFHGDKIWDKHTLPKPGIVRGDVSGSSLSEFRLRVGFIHVPLPFVGANCHRAVYSISNSEEMQAYSIGGSYDRPIPRRIVEEAGIARNRFGQSKKAASILFNSRPSLLSQDFRSRVKDAEKRYFSESEDSLLIYEIQKLEYVVRWYTARLLNKLAGSSKFLKSYLSSASKLLGGDLRTYEHNHPRSFFDLTTAVQLLAERYRLP